MDMQALRVPGLLARSLIVVMLEVTAVTAATTDDMPAAIGRVLDAAGPTIGVLDKPIDAEPLRAFYRERANQPLWTQGSQLGPRGQALLAALRGADREGLEPADYDVSSVISIGGDIDRAAAAEVMLSATLVRYAVDVRRGRTTAELRGIDRPITPKPVGPIRVLTGAADAPDLPAYIAHLAPTDPLYVGLRQALDQYRALAAAGGWPVLPDGPKLEPGDVDPRVKTLRQRLLVSGDLPVAVGAETGTRYGAGLRQAVVRFQERNGLLADGIVGPRTRDTLNVPVDARIRQIQLNLERARWMPDDLGDPHVLVNMAAFELQVVEGGHTALEMRVVVGETDKETPVFSDEITYIEFNPYWNLPRSIAVKEKLPQLRRDPRALRAQNIRVLGPGGAEIDPATVDWSTVGVNSFPYRLRQDPGERNALGRIKFMFPNQYDVYMHDTPSRALFQRSVRAFSHGCIRVEKPLELAEYLLRQNRGWQRERIEQAIASGKNRAIVLKQEVPVHLVYLTAWKDDDGKIQFRDDLYNRDAHLVATMSALRE
jgi:L,D-transpeptidase YcbB